MSAIWTFGQNDKTNQKIRTNNTLVSLTTNFRQDLPSLQLRTLSKRLQGAIKSWLCDTVVIHNQYIEGLAMMGLRSRSSSRCSMGRNGILIKIMSFFRFLSCIQFITISPRFKELLKKTGLKVTSIINDFWVLSIAAGKGKLHFCVWSWDLLSKC